jgi:hypothetical protein
VSALERQLVNSYAASSLINIPVSSQGTPVPTLGNLSSLSAVKSPTKQHAPLTSSNSVANCNAASHLKSVSSSREHRKLDRSVSEPADRSQSNVRPAPPNSSRYKTELCRPFEENGTCKYGDKCQFAHGVGELRTLTRHPKYKTELCRTFHTTGFCPYGPRCHFIHNSEDSKKCLLNTLQNNGSNTGNVSISSPRISTSPPAPKDLEICSFSLGSTGDLSPTSSSNSSGSPTSSLGGFFLDDSHLSYNLSQVPHTAPPIVSSGFFFGPEYSPALTTMSNLVSQPDYFSPQQNFEPEDNMMSSLNLLVTEMDNLNCQEEDLNCQEEVLSKVDQNTTLDINRNIIRLPIFSRLAHGSSP